jgi:hypothetical protein
VADVGDQWRQFLLTGTFNISPAVPKHVADDHAGLPMQSMIEGERQVDTPQVADIVLLQRFQHDPAGHTVCDAGLYYDLGLGMQRYAPCRTAQRTVTIGVPTVCVAPEAPPLGLQQRADVRHHLVELLILLAGPRRAQQFMQALIPDLIYFDLREFPASMPLMPLPNFSRQSLAYHDRMRSECKRQSHNLLQARPPPGHYYRLLG